VGRVQTPTLKMLVDRDAAITTFKKEKYYHVRLMLSGAEAVSERFSNRSEADTLKTALQPFICPRGIWAPFTEKAP
jgi:DNA topoisomerase-3